MSSSRCTSVTDDRGAASHAIPPDRLLSVVLSPHVLAHDVVSILPSFGVHVKGSSTGEIVALAVLLLPLGESAHVSFRRLARRPEIGDKGQEVEDEDERDTPFEGGSNRSDSVALRGRVTTAGGRATSTLILAGQVLGRVIHLQQRRSLRNRWHMRRRSPR